MSRSAYNHLRPILIENRSVKRKNESIADAGRRLRNSLFSVVLEEEFDTERGLRFTSLSLKNSELYVIIVSNREEAIRIYESEVKQSLSDVKRTFLRSMNEEV